MNKNQKIVLAVGLVVFAVAILFPPELAERYSRFSGQPTYQARDGRMFLLSHPSRSAINAKQLAVEIVLLVGLTGGAILLTKTSDKPKTQQPMERDNSSASSTVTRPDSGETD